MCPRIYGPLVARWLSRDFSPFDDANLCLYRYVGNDPPNLADPSGRQAALPVTTPAQQTACQKACQDARNDPLAYGLQDPNKTIRFVLCMPTTPLSSAVDSTAFAWVLPPWMTILV